MHVFPGTIAGQPLVGLQKDLGTDPAGGSDRRSPLARSAAWLRKRRGQPRREPSAAARASRAFEPPDHPSLAHLQTDPMQAEADGIAAALKIGRPLTPRVNEVDPR